MLDTCRICESRDLHRFLDLGEQPHCNSFLTADEITADEPVYPLDTLFCADCGLVQLSYAVSRETMFADHPYVSGTTATLPAHFRRLSQRITERYALDGDALVVDIGSNDGTWLKAFKGLGTKVLGVEAAAKIAALAEEQGVPTKVAFFGEETARCVREEHGAARVITAAGVFFHIDDLHDFVAGVEALLSDDGVFVVQAMYLRDIVERTAFDAIYHEHIEYYTLKPLTVLFDRYGLEIVDVERIDIHGGSFVIQVRRKGAGDPSPAVAATLAEEDRDGFYELATYERFAERVERVRDDLLDLLHELKDDGRRLAAYGAPARGNTLLNYCRIGPDLLEYASEKNPLKFGLYTPGMHIPVIDEAQADPPDAYLLLAWNFGEELLAKEQAYRDGGGRFVLPLPPDPHIV